MTSLIIAGGDLHIPFEDQNLVELFIRTVRVSRPDLVVLMGDVLDMRNLGPYLKDPFHSTSCELIRGRSFISKLRDAAGPKTRTRIVYLEGNHEKRLTKHVLRKESDLAELPELAVPSLLFLGDFDVEWWPEDKAFRHDGVLYRHGDRISQLPGRTAHMHIEKWWEPVRVGHSHRGAIVCQRVGDKIITGVETKCMCTFAAGTHYDPRPNWHPGFLIEKDGEPYLF